MPKHRDLESLAIEARKFKSRTELFKKNRAVYKLCRKLGILDQVCAHMNKYNARNGTHGNCTMSNSDIFLLAKPFNQKSRFKEAFPSAYGAARFRGILDQVCAHMNPIGNRYLRKIYVFEHSDNTAYVGLSYDPEKRRKDHLSKNGIIAEKSRTTKQTFKILTNLLSLKEAIEMEKFYINEYNKMGWTVLNKAKGGALGAQLKWSKERCLEIVRKCRKRSDFAKLFPSAYNSARRNGWVEELLSHFTKKKSKWELSELEDLAIVCVSKMDFKNRYPGAYKAARNMKVLDQICSHMNKDNRLLPYKDRPKLSS